MRDDRADHIELARWDEHVEDREPESSTSEPDRTRHLASINRYRYDGGWYDLEIISRNTILFSTFFVSSGIGLFFYSRYHIVDLMHREEWARIRSRILCGDHIWDECPRRKTHNNILRKTLVWMPSLDDRLFDIVRDPSDICYHTIDPVLATLSHTRESSTLEDSTRHIIDTSLDTIESQIDSDEPMIVVDMREAERHGKIDAKNIGPIVQKYVRKSTICKNIKNVTYCLYLWSILPLSHLVAIVFFLSSHG